MGSVLVLLQLPSAAMVVFLDVLSLAALSWRRTPPAVPPRHRFAVLVPAHDEEQIIARLLSSLSAISYPSHLYDVFVVADNCTDSTASAARASGAQVFERQDSSHQGKGHALRWLLAQIKRDETVYDAYVVIDADTVVSPNILDVLNRHLVRGDEVIQCYYGVANPGDSWSSALDYARLAVFNGLRPRGRDALGLSAGLHGNGMCFRAEILERFGWEAFALAEDVELHLKLVEEGTRVAYAADTSVWGEMPASRRQSRSQNIRWERGRLQMLREWGPRLLRQAIRRRDPIVFDAIAEQAIPPLSVLTAITGLFFLITTALRVPGARRLATAVLLGQIGYILTGLRLAHAETRIYAALLGAPLYVAWKLWVYILAAVHLGDTRWVRTARRSEQ